MPAGEGGTEGPGESYVYDEIPADHPLAPHVDDLDTHADHVEAYANVLDDLDPDDTHGLMVVFYGSDGIETLPTVADDVDPHAAAFWMLGAHIHHVTSSAREAGGSATMTDVAAQAIYYLRTHGFGGDA